MFIICYLTGDSDLPNEWLREISAFLSGSEAVREKTGVLGPAFWDTVARKGKNSLVKMGASSFTSSRTTGCSSVFTTGRKRENR